MAHRYFLTLFFLLSLVCCSFFKYKISPQAALKIDSDQYRYRLSRARLMSLYPRPSFMLREEVPRSFDPVALHSLYEMAERGTFEFSDIYEISFEEAFARNNLYVYTPAEWALHNGNLNILEVFINVVLRTTCHPERIEYFIKNLFTMAIQYKNLEALRLINESIPIKLDGKGFLAIAAQHHASNGILYYLLDECHLEGDLLIPASNGIFPKPLEASVRFNNLNAVMLFLRRKAPLGAKYGENPGKTALGLMFGLDKKRILQHLLFKCPAYCDYSDDHGNGLLHYAAMYARDPEILSIILESCPKLNVDSLNKEHFTPLSTIFRNLDFEKSGVAIKLIEAGADITGKLFDGSSPLESIIKYRFKSVFDCIVDKYHRDIFVMRRIVRVICEFESWPLLSKVMQTCPDIPKYWIDSRKIGLEALLARDNLILFQLALKLKLIPLTAESLEQIIQADKKEFLTLAFEYGADPSLIPDSTLKKLLEDWKYEMLDCIKDYSPSSLGDYKNMIDTDGLVESFESNESYE